MFFYQWLTSVITIQTLHYSLQSLGGIIDLYLFTRVDFFAAHKLETFLSNPGKVHFEGLVHLLIYIRGNNNFLLRYYAKKEDAPLYELLRQASINTENQLVVFSDYIWKDCPDTARSTADLFQTKMSCSLLFSGM